MKPTRLHEFDMMKGVAIFMVVMGHVIAFCVREIDRATIFKFIGEIHMPLFFFISGWFTMKVREGSVQMPNLLARFKQLIIPMVAVSTLWIFYFPHSGLTSPLNSTFEGLWTDNMKNGYWFTLALFELMVLYAASAPVLTRLKKASAGITYVVVVWVILFYLNKLLLTNFPVLADSISFPQVSTYWPAFMIGALASRHREGFAKITASSNWVTAAFIVGALCLYYICWYWEFERFEWLSMLINGPAAIRPILHICLAIIAMAIFGPWARQAFDRPTPGRLASMWSYLGTKSLGIYLLHYFFLFPLGHCRESLLAMNLGWVPLFAFTFIASALIIAMVLGFMAIIAPSRPLNYLLTGTITRSKK